MGSKRINEIRLQNLLDLKEEKPLKVILQEYCPQLSSDEIKTILGLKNSNNVNINIMDDRVFIYEMIGLINDIGYDKIINMLKKIGIKDEKIFFDLDVYDAEKAKYNDDIKKMREKLALKNGKKCFKCGNNNTYTTDVQRSSGDEGAKTINFCVDCQFFF
jgi:DNA-directed RNA polymerase subunit M/transcription elongation factor TFIIS